MRTVRNFLIVLGCLLALGAACETDPDTGELIQFDDEGNRIETDENDLGPAEGEFEDGLEDDGFGDDEESDVDESSEGGDESLEEDDDSINPAAPEFCNEVKQDSCDWEPAVHEGVWGLYGDLEPASDWQTVPDTSHRGDNPNPPLTFFIVDLPSGVVDAPGDWALLGVEVEGAALEGFTEGVEPRDPGCAPDAPAEAGAFLTEPGRRNVLSVDGWSTCLFETTPGSSVFTYAYEGNEGGLFDYWHQTTFGDGPVDWSIDVERDGVTAHSPDGRAFPILGDFDGDGEDDLRWSDALP